VKALPVETMQRHIQNGWLLGTHPVFGPGARNVTNHNIVLTPTNQAESALAERVKKYLEARHAKVHLMTPKEHDDMMAIILGLAHYIAIVSADSLSGFSNLKKMEAIGGVTYKVLLTLVESVISEDAGLYASLQVSLPNLPQMQQDFQQRCREWSELVANQDKAEFSRRMAAIRSKLEAGNPEFGKAYDNMYKIADNL
jgi:prephenate dehydrogenase